MRFGDFRIEHKVFACYLSNDGGSVCISERTRLASFEMKVSVAAAVWMRETLEKVIVKGGAGQFVSKYRGPSSVLIAERLENQRGVFLRFSQVRNGVIRNIMVPGGRFWWGWKKMVDCLGNTVGRRFTKKGVDISFHNGARSRNIPSNEDKQVSTTIKVWKLAVTIFRSNTSMSWGEVSRKLEFITNRKSEVFQVAADRAIFWCMEEQEVASLLRKPEQLSSNKTLVNMERWKKEHHWQNLQIEVSHSWIGIEGIPLLMWNIHVFKVIGEACGGFLEVAEETKNKSYLGYAMIKVKGFENCLMNPVIEIMCEGDKVCLGAFSIRGPKGGIQGYRSAGVTTRAIMQLNTDGLLDGDRISSGEVICQSPNLKMGGRNKAHGKDDADVLADVENTTLAEKDRADLLTSTSDRVGKGKATGLKDQEAFFSSNEGGSDCYGEAAKEKKIDAGNRQKLMAGTIAVPDSQSQPLALKNSFSPLLICSSCEAGKTKKYQTLGLGWNINRLHKSQQTEMGQDQTKAGRKDLTLKAGHITMVSGHSNQFLGLGQAQEKLKKKPTQVSKGGYGPIYSGEDYGPGQSRNWLHKSQLKGLGQAQIEAAKKDVTRNTDQISMVPGHLTKFLGLGKAQLKLKNLPTQASKGGDGPLSSGVDTGSGQIGTRLSKALKSGSVLDKLKYYEVATKTIATKRFSKIKPKNPTSFVQGKIFSSQVQDQVDSCKNMKVGSCTLGSLLSPTTQQNGHNKGFRHSNHPDCNFELCGLPNFVENSTCIEDIDLDSDGDAPCLNMTFSSSSAATDDEEGEEADSQFSEDYEFQTDNQLEALEDIRKLFNEDQERTVNSVQVSNFNSNFLSNRDCSIPQPLTVIHPITHKNHCENEKRGEVAKVVEELIGEDLIEVEVIEEKGKQLTEQGTRWEDIVEMAQNMGFCLVPCEKLKLQKEKTTSVRKHGEKRELRNLRFDINFKGSEFKRGTFNSK